MIYITNRPWKTKTNILLFFFAAYIGFLMPQFSSTEFYTIMSYIRRDARNLIKARLKRMQPSLQQWCDMLGRIIMTSKESDQSPSQTNGTLGSTMTYYVGLIWRQRNLIKARLKRMEPSAQQWYDMLGEYDVIGILSKHVSNVLKPSISPKWCNVWRRMA